MNTFKVGDTVLYRAPRHRHGGTRVLVLEIREDQTRVKPLDDTKVVTADGTFWINNRFVWCPTAPTTRAEPCEASTTEPQAK